MRWRLRSQKNVALRKKTSLTCTPAESSGKKLARVEALMHNGDAVPRVAPGTRMPDVIYEMSRKKLGMTTVVEDGKLLGVISDGDLRRLLEHRGKDALDLTAGECMTAEPKTISPHEFAATALALMEEKRSLRWSSWMAIAVCKGSSHLTICGVPKALVLEGRRPQDSRSTAGLQLNRGFPMYHYDPHCPRRTQRRGHPAQSRTSA